MIAPLVIIGMLIAGAWNTLRTYYPEGGEVCIQCTLSSLGKVLIREFEGYYPVPYKDSGGLLTIGYGHLIKKDEVFDKALSPGDAEALLEKDLIAPEKTVNTVKKRPLKVTQYDALVSFTYNVGDKAFEKSKLLEKVNKNENVDSEFTRWVFVNGKKITGLERRRAAEKNLYNFE